MAPSTEVQGNLLFPSRAKQQIAESEFEGFWPWCRLTDRDGSAKRFAGRPISGRCYTTTLEGEDIPRLLERTLAS